MDERQLIIRLKNSERKAFEEAYAHNKELVLKTICKKIDAIEDAEELLQDVFVKAFRKIHQFNAQSRLSTWLVRIAIRTSQNFLKNSKTKVHINDIDEDNLLINVVTDIEDPEVVLQQKDMRKVALYLLSKLKDRQRTACTLHYLEGLTQLETAEIMGLSLDAIESLIHRAKIKMKSLILHSQMIVK